MLPELTYGANSMDVCSKEICLKGSKAGNTDTS